MQRPRLHASFHSCPRLREHATGVQGVLRLLLNDTTKFLTRAPTTSLRNFHLPLVLSFFCLLLQRLLIGWNQRCLLRTLILNLTEDADVIKAQLHRLTGRATFPNIMIQAHSIGGSDDIEELHATGMLEVLLKSGGLNVGGPR